MATKLSVAICWMLLAVEPTRALEAKAIRQDDLFVAEPADQLLMRDSPSTLAFFCRTVAYNRTVAWLKDGKELGTDARYATRDNGTILEVKRATGADAGRYQCSVTLPATGDRFVSNYARVTLAYLNQMTRQMPAVRAAVGKHVRLACPITGYSPRGDDAATFTWTASDGVTYRRSVTAGGGYAVTATGALMLLNPQLSDSRRYRCRVDVKWMVRGVEVTDSRTSRDVELVVVDDAQPSAPPELALPPRGVTYAEIGLPVTLECYFGGNPLPRVAWTKLGVGEIVSVGNGAVAFARFERAHQGTYVCDGSNAQGAARARTVLLARYKPVLRMRGSDDTVLVTRFAWDDFATVECHADATPVATFEWYGQGEPLVNPADGPHWFSVTQVDADTSRLTILIWNSSVTGVYQCLATNDVGTSVIGVKLTGYNSLLETVNGTVAAPSFRAARRSGESSVAGNVFATLLTVICLIACYVR